MPRGYDSNGNRTGGGRGRQLQRRNIAKYNPDDLSLDAMWECMKAAMAAGGALRIGMTRDWGAMAIGVYGDGEPYTEYLRPGDDGAQFFNDLRTIFEGSLDEMARNIR